MSGAISLRLRALSLHPHPAQGPRAHMPHAKQHTIASGTSLLLSPGTSASVMPSHTTTSSPLATAAMSFCCSRSAEATEASLCWLK